MADAQHSPFSIDIVSCVKDWISRCRSKYEQHKIPTRFEIPAEKEWRTSSVWIGRKRGFSSLLFFILLFFIFTFIFFSPSFCFFSPFILVPPPHFSSHILSAFFFIHLREFQKRGLDRVFTPKRMASLDRPVNPFRFNKRPGWLTTTTEASCP